MSRSRFRWLVEQDTIEPIIAGDPVELWCCGVNVPGAWLECVVNRVTAEGLYELSKVSVSGHSIMVPRSRIRLTSHQKRPLSNKSPLNEIYNTHATVVKSGLNGEGRNQQLDDYQYHRRLSARLEQYQHGYNGGVNVSDMHPRERQEADVAGNNAKACIIM